MRRNRTCHEPEIVIATVRARIAWLLDSPGTSAWLKTALRGVDGQDPISLQNDIELLRLLIAPLAACPIEVSMLPLSTRLVREDAGCRPRRAHGDG